MVLTVVFLIALLGFITAVVSAAGHAPLWVPVVLTTIFCLLQSSPWK